MSYCMRIFCIVLFNMHSTLQSSDYWNEQPFWDTQWIMQNVEFSITSHAATQAAFITVATALIALKGVHDLASKEDNYIGFAKWSTLIIRSSLFGYHYGTFVKENLLPYLSVLGDSLQRDRSIKSDFKKLQAKWNSLKRRDIYLLESRPQWDELLNQTVQWIQENENSLQFKSYYTIPHKNASDKIKGLYFKHTLLR